MDSGRKRRRGLRRRLDRVAISASLLLDERMNGEDVGLVSQDLFQSLFQSKGMLSPAPVEQIVSLLSFRLGDIS